jgi:integrase/recombinase XerD
MQTPSRAIYQRLKLEEKGWRYQRIQEGRGRRTGDLKPPFYIRLTIHGGSQPWQRLTAESFTDAKQEAGQFESVLVAAAKGLTVAEAENIDNLNRVPIKTAVGVYLEQKRHKAPKTVAAYTHYLTEFAESLQGKIRFLDQITPEVLRCYKDFLTAQGYSGKTVDTRINMLYFMLKKNGVTARLPKDEMPIVEIEVAVPYSDEEWEKLLAVMDDEQRIRFQFFRATGCRDREVTFASWADIDFGKREYHIRRKEDVGFSPKSHESRTVPLPGSLVEALRARRKAHPNDRWLFVNKDGRPDNHFLRAFKRIALRAGLNCGNCSTSLHKWKNGKMRVRDVTCKTAPVCEHFFLHRIRKTTATSWAEAGIPLRTIQVWLGHKNLEVTQRYLGVTDSGKLRPQIDKAYGD